MKWNVKFIPEAIDDFQKLDNNNKIIVRKAIQKVMVNPISTYEGGYGHPLSNLKNKLFGFFKINLKAAGIRIVYKVIKSEYEMLIIIIGFRADNEVYELVEKRIKKII